MPPGDDNAYCRLEPVSPPENPGGIPGVWLFKGQLDVSPGLARPARGVTRPLRRGSAAVPPVPTVPAAVPAPPAAPPPAARGRPRAPPSQELECASFEAELRGGGWTADRDGKDQAIHYGRLPPFAQELALRLPRGALAPDIAARRPLFDQTIVNTYGPGQGIPSHVDLATFEDGVAGFCFGGTCVMELTPAAPTGNRALGGPAARAPATRPAAPAPGGGGSWELCAETGAVRVLLEPGDVYVLSGEGRYAWAHGIPAVEADTFRGRLLPRSRARVSVTLRKMRPAPPSPGPAAPAAPADAAGGS